MSALAITPGVEAPPRPTCAERCWRLINQSSSADFPTPLAWGQWCRDVATAAGREDHETLDELEARVIKSPIWPTTAATFRPSDATVLP